MKKDVRPIYSPPLAKDLSMKIASGEEGPVTGQCVSGPTPYEECVVGPSPQGYNPPCTDGWFVDDPLCSVGLVAASVCMSGTNQAG